MYSLQLPAHEDEMNAIWFRILLFQDDKQFHVLINRIGKNII